MNINRKYSGECQKCREYMGGVTENNNENKGKTGSIGQRLLCELWLIILASSSRELCTFPRLILTAVMKRAPEKRYHRTSKKQWSDV